jgi:NADH:ubiquinone oxidoreductase subunit F (NADH-binding)
MGHHDSWQRALTANLESSGLTGRGGGGFPSAAKLAMASAHGHGGTLVVNAMEGEPASDKDKVLLSRAPHLVLDGAQFLAALCGARRIVVCIPVGRDGIAAVVEHAIGERSAAQYARRSELVVRPPDRFVAGEESALVHWIDDQRSLPVFRPDKSIPLRLGPEGFLARGLVEEPGTSLVTLSGAVAQPGVVEVDRGTPLSEIVRRGTPVEPAQALLVGGYGGNWVGPEHFDTPYASLSLRTIGASAGVGVIVVLGEHSCGVAETAHIARYLAGQSSGQCGPCVFGLPAIADDLALLARGQADRGLMARLARRLDQVNGRGACRHPDGAVSLVRSALSVFAPDVSAHEKGEPCAHWHKPSSLPFPRLMAR